MTTLGALMGFFLLSGLPAGQAGVAPALSADRPAAPLVFAPSVSPAAEAPAPVVIPDYTVTMTAYNAVPEQTDDDPFTTASGAYSNPEIIAARSQDLAKELPFGTIVEVHGPAEPEHSCGYQVVAPAIGYRVIADVMNARYTDRIDILFGTEVNYTFAGGRVKNAGTVLGICSGVTVRVVGFVDPRRLPKTQIELAALVEGSPSLAVK